MTGFYLQISAEGFLPLFSFMLGTYGLICRGVRWRFAYGRRWLYGVVVYLFLFCWGLGLPVWQAPDFVSNHYSRVGDKPPRYFVLLAASKTTTNSGRWWKVTWRVVACGSRADMLHKSTGSMISYLHKEEKVVPGRFYVVKGNYRELSGRKYPWGFDYRKYLSRQGIFHQLWVEDIWACKSDPVWEWRSALYRWRSLLSGRFDALPGRSAGLIRALVLGQKDDLHEEVESDYRRVGAAHVLAVSGLHVGIVAFGLRFLLGLIPWQSRKKSWLVGALSVLGVGFFALLSGAGPSVCRAALMFSLLLLGREWFRRSNIWNVVAASAFILLSVDADQLFSVGFQLSYAAVCAIIFFYPYLYRCLALKATGADYAWQLLCVGMAAQIGTGALNIFYFHQFPALFWLSGLVVVPLATLNLFSGLIYLALQDIPYLGTVLEVLLQTGIWLMNFSMEKLAAIPHSILTDLNWSLLQVLLYYLLVAIMGAYLYTKRLGYVLASLFLVLIFLMWSAFQANRTVRQAYLLPYAGRGGVALEWISGRHSLTLIPDSSRIADLAYAQEQLHQERGVRHATLQVVGRQNLDLRINGRRFWWLQVSPAGASPPDSIDYLLWSIPLTREQWMAILPRTNGELIWLGRGEPELPEGVEEQMADCGLTPIRRPMQEGYLIKLKP